MRAPDDARSGPRRRLSRRGRIAVTVLTATVVVLFLSLRGIAGVYTDFLWFSSVELSSVWTGILGARVALRGGGLELPDIRPRLGLGTYGGEKFWRGISGALFGRGQVVGGRQSTREEAEHQKAGRADRR